MKPNQVSVSRKRQRTTAKSHHLSQCETLSRHIKWHRHVVSLQCGLPLTATHLRRNETAPYFHGHSSTATESVSRRRNSSKFSSKSEQMRTGGQDSHVPMKSSFGSEATVPISCTLRLQALSGDPHSLAIPRPHAPVSHTKSCLEPLPATLEI
jgi:hypothetical protein